MNAELMNFIILYYCHLDTICSRLRPLATTYSFIRLIFGNYKIHSNVEIIRGAQFLHSESKLSS